MQRLAEPREALAKSRVKSKMTTLNKEFGIIPSPLLMAGNNQREFVWWAVLAASLK